MPKFASNVPTMDNVFKQHPRPEARQGLLRDYRLKATEVLQQSMPESIVRLQALIAEEANPDHPLWPGHLEQGQFVADNVKLTMPAKVKATAAPNANGGTAVDEQAQTEEEEIGHDPDDEDDHVKDVQSGGDKSVKKGFKGGVGDDTEGRKAGTSYPYTVPVNEIVSQVILIVRKEAEDLHQQLNTLRTWIALEAPIIEDGNSFGADVQSHLSEQLDKYHSRAGGYINGLNRHHHDRMAIVRRWVQTPNMRSHAEDLASSDRMDHHLARAYINNMLLACGSLLGNFEKNWEKVINPKGRGGGSGEGMY